MSAQLLPETIAVLRSARLGLGLTKEQAVVLNADPEYQRRIILSHKREWGRATFQYLSRIVEWQRRLDRDRRASEQFKQAVAGRTWI